MAINLSSMLIKHINKPCVKDRNIVLYTHIAGYQGELLGSDVEISKNAKLMEIGQRNYSSPTNIRRVFITSNKVSVQTYKPIIKSGKPDVNGCWNVSSLEKENIKDIFVNNEKERFTGNILKVFSKPWVISNIEEIYIDWTLLLSDDIQNRFPEAAQLLQSIINNSGGRLIKSDLPQRIFEDANGGNIKSIRERYPRLKCISMISNLEQVINSQYDKGKSNGSTEDFTALWIENEINKRLIEQSNSVIILNTLFDDIGRVNRNFAIRDGVYKFDAEILKPYFVNIRNRMLEEAREKRDSQIENKGTGKVFNTNVTGKVEQEINNIINESGSNKAQMIFKLALSTLTKSQAEGIIGGKSNDSVDNIFIAKMRELQKIIGNEEIRRAILEKYEMLSEMLSTKDLSQFIRDHAESYKVLLASNIVNWLRMEVSAGSEFIRRSAMKHFNLLKLITDEKLIDALCNKFDITRNDYSGGIDSIIKALSEFNKKKDSVDIEIEGDFDDYLDNDDESEFDMDGFDDYMEEDEIEHETLVVTTESDVENTPANNEPADIEIDDFDNYLGEDAEDNEKHVTNEEVIVEQTPADGGETEEVKSRTMDEKYYPKIHDSYKNKISSWLLDVWKDLYGNYVNGIEIVNGLIVPGETILSDGETRKYCGVLRLSNRTTVNHEIIANGIYEEFLSACKESGIPIVAKVSDDSKNIRKYTYHPLFQRRIVSGSISPDAFKNGWSDYSTKLIKKMENEIKEIAIELEETGSDTAMYERLSGYITSIMVMNYKNGLGMQLRICCGDTSKTNKVATLFYNNLIKREKTHQALANGKLVVGEPIISDNGYSFTMSIYTNMAGYQAVPQFMGELLCNMQEGTFKPSVDNMIIGTDLNNEIVTAPFVNWLLPIIAWSRSGKGVLTLNMLLNIIGTGTPLFYLDGKPDMASLLWNLNKKHGIENAVVIDGIQYKGVTDVDKKPFRAPYAAIAEMKMREKDANSILTSNIGIMIYLKTMMIILMAVEYYKTEMGRPYGNLFVVFDEVYKIIVQQGTTLGTRLNMEESKAKNLSKEEKQEKGNEILAIRNFVDSVLQSYIGNDIGVFGSGIKAVALTQHTMVEKYKVEGLGAATQFAKGFLLQRGPKLFGRQGTYGGTYGMKKGKSETTFELYDKYFHFGIGDSNDTDTDSAKTFKPLLVLNESDPKEVTGKDEDGAFVKDMMSRVKKVANEEEFRDKYFRGDPALTRAIGFEGALDQIGRLTGSNWVDNYRLSMERAYDITDKALRYYGVIGTEGINSVYDYICSCRVEHLWSWDDIVEAKRKGISLGQKGITSNNEGSTIFDFDDESLSGMEELDFNSIGTENIEDNEEEYIDLVSSIEGQEKVKKKIHEDVRKFKPVEEPTVRNVDSSYQEIGDKQPAGRVIGRSFINKAPIYNNNIGDIIKLDKSNSIKASMNHKVDKKYENFVFKTMAGSRYEFKKRWESIIESICNTINSNLVTRMVITSDEIVANNRMVIMDGILGGDADVRIEDIIDFKTLLKRFKGLRQLHVDEVIFQRAMELYKDPLLTFFEYSKSLQTVYIIGNEIVQIDRNSYIENHINQEQQRKMKEIKHKSQLEVISASRNRNFNKRSPGYKSRIWDATKRYQGNAWGAIGKGLLKDNPKYFRLGVIALSSLAVLTVGGTISAFQGIFKMFK